MLRAQGYTTLTAESGVRGILVWEQHKAAIDVILSDVFMPGIDGLTLARELRNRRFAKPIILMSSKLDDNGRWIAEEAGFQLLQKPFKDEELLTLLAGLMPAR
jgi:CheY-like chemotaxis protein